MSASTSTTSSFSTQLPFGQAAAGTTEFAEFFRWSALRFFLPLTAIMITAYVGASLYVGSKVSVLAYFLICIIAISALLSRRGRIELALRIFMLTGLSFAFAVNWPGETTSSGYATGGVYLICLFPTAWWMCFTNRAARLAVIALCAAALATIAAVGQYDTAPVTVPDAYIVLNLVRTYFIMSVLLGICHGFEIAIDRFHKRWTDSYTKQEGLTRQLQSQTNRMSAEAEAHRETLVHLSRSETRLRHLFDHAFEGITVFDLKQQKTTEANRQLARTLGYNLEELDGFELLDLSPTHQSDGTLSAAALQEVAQRVASGEAFEYEWTFAHKSGYEVEMAITTFGVPGEEDIRISVFRDLTMQKEASRKLAMANQELRTFAHAASHDLKEPLRTMSNFAKLLGRRYSDVVDDAGREYIGFILDAAQRGTSLVTDLLRYAEVGNESVDTTPVDLNLIAATVRQNVSAHLHDCGGTLTIGKLPTVGATETWAKQLLQNLVSNALKFTREGVAPEVHITSTSTRLGHEISVRDNGIGIEEKHLDKVFGVFERVVRRDQYEGSGLGLSLCRRIVGRLGGDIRVSSTVGQGTTFTVWLPPVEMAQRQVVKSVAQLSHA